MQVASPSISQAVPHGSLTRVAPGPGAELACSAIPMLEAFGLRQDHGRLGECAQQLGIWRSVAVGPVEEISRSELKAEEISRCLLVEQISRSELKAEVQRDSQDIPVGREHWPVRSTADRPRRTRRLDLVVAILSGLVTFVTEVSQRLAAPRTRVDS